LPSRPHPGCQECERLLDHFAAVIEENMHVLREYHQALKERNPEKIEEMRDIIAGCDAFRKIVKDEIVAHQAQHAGWAREAPLRKSDSP
jgi:hypothetical protein